jgi:hypothetical protein
MFHHQDKVLESGLDRARCAMYAGETLSGELTCGPRLFVHKVCVEGGGTRVERKDQDRHDRQGGWMGAAPVQHT